VYINGSSVTSVTFIMIGGTISGNTATHGGSGGGGVFMDTSGAIFRIVNGTIYGQNEADENLRNYGHSGAAFYNYYIQGTAERGTFSIPGDVTSTWTAKGTISSITPDTLKVANGDIVP